MTFKIFSARDPAGEAFPRANAKRFKFILKFRRSAMLLLVLLSAAGCQTARPLPPANLQEPGWTVREGQAIWRKSRVAPEIAGEILLATRDDGRAFVQFTKNPFPLIIAQSTRNSWHVEVPTQNQRFSGHGKPPKRLIWLYLPRVLSGSPPPKGWSWKATGENGWRLENGNTGESLEGFFSQ